jgi:Ser/Thr protein kinase RdoA (MazF antagonist)
VIRDDTATGEQFCAALGLAFGPQVTVSPVARGAMGQVWCLDLGAVRYAVKELFWAADEESVRREAACTAQLAAAGIRLPGSLPDRAGRFIVRLPARAGGRWLRRYQWVDGVPVNRADPAVAGQAGDLLGRLHAHAPPPRGPADPWYQTVPDPAAWDRLAGTAIEQGAPWATVLARQTGLLRELAGLVTPAALAGQVTCHRDVHPDNVLVGAAGELILLDWDDVGPASPDRELARMLADWFGYGSPVDAPGARRALAAYQAAGGPGRLRDERSFGMLIACRLNFLQAQAAVALDPAAAPEHRRYASAEISDSLAHLPGPAMMAELIALAAAG